MVRLNNKLIRPINSKIMVLGLILACLFLGSIYIVSTWRAYSQYAEERMRALTEAAVAFIPVETVAKLQDSDQIAKDPVYRQLKESLILFKEQNPGVILAGVYTNWNGKIYAVVDSEPQNYEPYLLPGQRYPEIDSKLRQFLLEDSVDSLDLSVDREGDSISIFVPVKDNSSTNVKAVLGVDFSASLGVKEAMKHVGHAIAVVVSVLMFLIVLFNIIRKNEALKSLDLKLQESEAQFKTIFERASVGIAIIGKNRHIIKMNDKFAEILARSKEELVGMNWVNLIYPEDLEKNEELLSAFEAGDIENYTLEKRFVKPDGSSIWANMDVTTLQQNRGQEYLCIIQDINSRKLIEEALRESERSKSVLLSHLPGMAYRCRYDREWTMEFLSDGCLELTGYTSECLIDNRQVSFNDLIVPEYREIIWQEWERVLALREQFKFEYEIITAKGERKWVWEIGQGIYDEDGKVEELEGIVIDITDSKQKMMQIQYLNDHDIMTGLYNRRYYEKTKNQLDKEEYLPLSIIISDINGIKIVNDAFGYPEGDRLIMETAKIIQGCCREEDIVARTGGDEFKILMPNTSREEAYKFVQRIMQACEDYNRRIKDQVHNISISVGFSTKLYPTENIRQIEKEAEEYMFKHKLLEQESHHSTMLSSIMATMYARSQETEEHAKRLALLSRMIGERLNLQQESMDELELFAMLHDIGKIGIDDRILNKPGKLNDEEWKIMKKHSEIGYRITMSSPGLQSIANYILTHHERWDGKGYPQGLKGEEIPLPSRILAVVDAYDAMTEDRVYRKAMSHDQALREIKKCAGTQFDPHIVNIFVQSMLHFDRKQFAEEIASEKNLDKLA